MCGIAGVIALQKETAQNAVSTMNLAQAHRGPDNEGLQTLSISCGYLTFGHRRLSIIDLSEVGHQPMQNLQTGDWIVYNGEIYNFPELRENLKSWGAIFKSNSDTEVILHAYARWGTACFEKLHGMFALAIYDNRQKEIILARDPLGIKPLYYAVLKNNFIFASELKAIDATELTSKEVDSRGLAGLLAYGAVQGPITMRKDVKLLEPGTLAVLELTASTLDKCNLKFIKYWDFPQPHTVEERSDAITKVSDLLINSARRHLLSDVPVGVFLSSGLDSTSLAILCSDFALEKLNTFTIGLTDRPEIDENPIAEITARQLNSKHHAIYLSDLEVQQQAKMWFDSLDQPSVDGLNTYIISGAVRKLGIKVAISGLGGDELFGGYSTFSDVPKIIKYLSHLNWIPKSILSSAAGIAFINKSKAQKQKAKELAATSPFLRQIYTRRRRLFSDLEMTSMGFDAKDLRLSEDFLPEVEGLKKSLNRHDLNSGVGILESRLYMGNMLLRDSDVFGMAHGVEIRVPFLDRQLVDYVMGLPGKWRVGQKGKNKPLLFDAMVNRLPQNVQNLPKRGFSLSQAKWMVGPLREQFEEYLGAVKKSRLINKNAANGIWKDFLDDQEGPTWSRAWLLGVLGAWLMRNDVH